ncbi:hypothetical protein H2201_003057 [Coniosporium apollinis]|uniref:DNA repair protein Rad26 n=1 Tax=Coniosporium apollinis TaxID=61459 RepID=A0ABQ9P255_9PEZI|nr:hypothetical protein H2201_003057 [Coniosporium apollinis]
MANQGDDDDDFDFGDDDLDVATLQELSTQAFNSPQQQRSAPVAPPQRKWQPPVVSTRNAPVPAAHPDSGAAVSKPGPPSSEYDFDDEDVIDLDQADVPLPAVEGTTIRHHTGQPQQGTGQQLRQEPSLNSQQHASTGRSYQLVDRTEAQQSSLTILLSQRNNVQYTLDGATYQDDNGFEGEEPGDQGGDQIDVSALQAQIDELECDRVNLLKRLQDAQSTVQAQAGEIAIIRRNQDKANREHERRLSVQQKLHADTLAKQKAELEAAKKDREKVETDNRFLEHDLVQEAKRAKQAARAVRDGGANARTRAAGQGSPATTPKKARPVPFGDGFDDDDIVMVSPSKSRDRRKGSTPRAGEKRKRAGTEQGFASPSQSLSFSEAAPLPMEEPTEAQGIENVLDVAPHLSKEDERFEFIQRFFNHRPYAGHDRTFEAFTKLAFPSTPTKTLSSFVLDELPSLSRKDTEDFPHAFCTLLLSLWERCLSEGYYAPVYLLIDALQFILAHEPLDLAVALISKIVPLALQTADLVAVPIGRAATTPHRPFPKTISSPSKSEIGAQISVHDCLALVQTVAMSCILDPPALTRFWQHMQYDFILVLLLPAQPLLEITLMLELLATSALDATFGAIWPGDLFNPDRQSKAENETLDKVTALLFEVPFAPRDGEPWTPTELMGLRLEALGVLAALCRTEHGSSLLRQNRNAIGLLVRFLNDTIDALYAYHPALHTLQSRAVNRSMRILHHLLTTSPSSPNNNTTTDPSPQPQRRLLERAEIQQKLRVVPGGNHKFLVALTRLAFSEPYVLEAGIEEGVMDMAHQILDEFLSPEEGEALMNVYSSSRSGVEG